MLLLDEPEKTEQPTSDPQVQDKEIEVEGSKQDQEPVDTEKSASTGQQSEDTLSMDKEKKDKKGKAAVGTSGSASDALEDALADIGYKDLEEELAVDLGNTSLNAKGALVFVVFIHLRAFKLKILPLKLTN